MTPLVRWFHQLGSPPTFDRFAARWAPWCYAAALAVMAYGLWQGLFVVPADYQQGDSFRILYIHVPAAWMSLFVFGLMAFYAAIALIWRIKLCEILAMACAPVGAAFTVITLATGSIWGKPMWGTWWEWDPRLTTELILLFLYLGVIGLYQAIDDRRAAARAAGLLAIVGTGLLPVIRYSVVWWNSLHQGQTIRIFGESSMDSSMLPPLIAMVIATKFWFAGSLLVRARADNLEREAAKAWVPERAGTGGGSNRGASGDDNAPLQNQRTGTAR
jgi:heme exporter protein C